MDTIFSERPFGAPHGGENLKNSAYWQEIEVSAEAFGINPVDAHLKAREKLENGSFDSEDSELDSEDSELKCKQLLGYSEGLIAPYASAENTAQNKIIESTLQLLKRLWQYHPPLAIEGVEVAEIALLTASEVDETTGVRRDRVNLWSAANLHDLGNIMLPIWLIKLSEEGKLWLPEHMEAKKPHSFWGRVLANLGGLPDIGVGRVIYTNHAKQLGCDEYGNDVQLRPGAERLDHDDVADADHGLARMTRNNERNRGINLAERARRMSVSTRHLRGDYWTVNEVNNPAGIGDRVDAVRLDFIHERYRFEQTPEGLLAVRKAGELALLAA